MSDIEERKTGGQGGTAALLEAALSYAARGWPVFPCEGKRPLTAHGLKDATTDSGQILRISRGSAYEAARRGEIPVIRLGRRILVSKAALLRLLGGEGV